MNGGDYPEQNVSRREPPWFLVTGLLIGLIVGLLFSLVISPVKYKDTAPSALADSSKMDYRLLIARAYQASPDLLRASQRLALLQDSSPWEILSAQAQQALTSGDEPAARALAGLNSALAAASLSTPSPAITPAAGSTSPAVPIVAQPSAGPDKPFVIVDRQPLCDSAQSNLLQIEVQDADGSPLPGVQITLAWDGGLDTFFTGVNPSAGAGFADFQMAPGVKYSLRVGEGGETLNSITSPSCSDASGNAFSGGLKLTFKR